ncbi:MAG: hypothetical protein J6W81_01360 [Lentisphaeria bacterium]|nr:hypothetical protein [Lentisphaeria bacterium]
MNSKISFTVILAVFSLGLLNAEEFFKITKPEDFRKPAGIVQENDILIIKGKKELLSNQKLVLDPAKKYRLSGQFRLQSGSPVRVWMGYNALDSKGRTIYPIYVLARSGTETELAEDVKPGDKVIKIKDGSKWNANSPYTLIAFNAKDDFSDLPNRAVDRIVKDGVKQNGGVWEITLKSPTKQKFAAGTKVRQHADGATHIWNAGHVDLKNQWVTARGILQGSVKVGNPRHKLWPGTKNVRLLIQVNGKPDSVTELRGIKIEEIQ